MKIKEGFELRDICGEQLIIAHGIKNIDFTKVVRLNETAAFLWNKFVDTDFNIDDMVSALTAEYDVSQEQAHADCTNLVASLSQAGFIYE